MNKNGGNNGMNDKNKKSAAEQLQQSTALNRDLVCDADDADDETFDRSLLKEAQRVVDEIKFGVAQAQVSRVLDNTESLAYMNIRTLENEDYCVELSASGYMIVAHAFDRIDSGDGEASRFETCEALMHQISPAFVKKFNTSVAERLNSINSDPTTTTTS